jgi:hypothetical protein
MRFLAHWTAAIGMAFVGSSPAAAQFYTVLQPGPEYTSTTTLIPIAAADFSSVSSLSSGAQSLTFSASMTAFTVQPGGWSAWGAPPATEGSSPRVLATEGEQTSFTITLGSPTATFGFEIEPANAGGPPPTPFTITVTFLNGATTLGTVARPILYNGALLAAASSATPITSVRINAPAAAGGFALARFRFGSALIGGSAPAIPALGPAWLAALGVLLAAGGTLLIRRLSPARN